MGKFFIIALAIITLAYLYDLCFGCNDEYPIKYKRKK